MRFDSVKVFKKSFLEKVNDFYFSHKVVYNCGILALLFFFNCYLQTPTFIVWPLIIALILLDDINNGMTYYIFSVPFCCIDMQCGVYFMIASMVAFVGRLYITKYFIEKRKIDFDLLSLMAAFLIFIILPLRQITATTFMFFILFLTLFLVLNAVFSFPEQFNIRKNVKVFTLAIFISVVFSVNYFFSDYIFFNREMYMERDVTRFTALMNQPNALAQFCEFGLIIFGYYILSNKAKPIEYVCFSFLGILGIFTRSKTYFILFCVIMLSLVIYLYIKNWKWGLGLTVGVAILAAAFVLIKKDFVMGYINRFFDKETFKSGDFEAILNYFTTERYDLWKEYLTTIFEHPWYMLVGFGPNKPRLNILSTHNVYIGVLYQFGLIGTMLFIAVIAKCIYNYVKRYNLKFNKAIIMPLVVVGLLFMVEDLIMYMY